MPNERIWVVTSLAEVLFQFRDAVMLKSGIWELEVIGERPEVNVKLGERVGPLVRELHFRVEEMKLFQEDEGPDVDDSGVDEITEGSKNVVEAMDVVLSHLEEIGAGGVPVLVKVMVNCEDKLLEDIGVLVNVTVSRKEELVSGIPDVLKKAVEVTTYDRIEEPVRKVDELLIRELGLIESNDERAMDVVEGVVF